MLIFLIAEKFSSWLTHKCPGPELLRHVTGARQFSAAPPPPPESALQQESFLSGSSGSYVEEMYEAWSYDPKSVHASWDAYFRYILNLDDLSMIYFLIQGWCVPSSSLPGGQLKA